MNIRRAFVFSLVALFATLDLGACASSSNTDGQDDVPKAAPGFPTGYTAWKKVNAETIVRADENIAREVYANTAGELGAGTVLVKEQYAYDGAVKGEMQLIAVMRRGADLTTNKGWTFSGYDPTTKAAKGEVTACAGCHSLKEDNDFLFSDKSTL